MVSHGLNTYGKVHEYDLCFLFTIFKVKFMYQKKSSVKKKYFGMKI